MTENLRKFCKKVWQWISWITTPLCGKTRNSLPYKSFSSNQFRVKYLVKYECGKTKNLLLPNKIPSNHLFSKFISKNVVFTRFLPKKWKSNFRYFHTAVNSANSFSPFLPQKFRQINVFVTKSNHKTFSRNFRKISWGLK